MDTANILVILLHTASIIVTPYIIAIAILSLAKQNLFWTYVEEGHAKAIMVNGQFFRVIMSLEGYIFANQDPRKKTNVNDIEITRDKDGFTEYEKKGPHPWDIIEDDREKKGNKIFSTLFPFTKGIKWIGFYPFVKIHLYNFKWASLEEGEAIKKSEILDYVLIKSDIYFSEVSQAETKKGERIPLDIKIILTMQVKNPYKALFLVQNWLEAVENQVGASIRKFTGTKTFDELITVKDVEKEILSNDVLGKIPENVGYEYGVEIKLIQISDINPSDEEIRNAMTAVYISKQEAKANKIEGEGLAKRATELYRAVSKIEGGSSMFTAEQIKDSKLTVITSPGSLLPAINVADVSKKGDE